MDSDAVYRQIRNLIQHWGTNDPLQLAADMGIMLYDCPDFSQLLGMYTCRWRHRMVLAHEIGHDQLHRHLAGGEGLREFRLFHTSSQTEYEANVWAAHLLIDNGELMELIRNGYDAAAAASMLGVDVNLLLIKVQQMQKLGMRLRMPYAPDSTFFRKIRES